MKSHFLFAQAVLAVICLTPAQANVGETYGFGSRSAALGGAVGSWNADGFASYTNPAQLGLMGKDRLWLSFGLIYMQPEFLPIDGIVVENNWSSDKSPPRYGSVNMDYKATFGQAIGVAYQIDPEGMKVGVGATLFLPLLYSTYIDTGEVYLPEYALYRNRTQRPQVELATGLSVAPGFSIGAGAHIGFGVQSYASVFLQTDPTRPSYTRQSAAAKPKASPYVGFLYAYGQSDTNAQATPPFSLSGVIRFPLDNTFQTQVQTGTGLFTGYPSLDVGFDANSSAIYDPTSFEFGAQFEVLTNFHIFTQLDYQLWSKYQSPALNVTNPTGISVSTGYNPVYATRDIIIPRIGGEYQVGDVKMRLGYAYRPSIFPSTPDGIGNYLDPAKHMWGVGLGFDCKTLLGMNLPHEFNIHGSWHQLVTQTIVKTPGNEAGNTSDQKIGYPGYQAGGKVVGGGLSLSFKL